MGNFSQRSLERLLQDLKTRNLIIFKGSKKTGGYFSI